MSRPTAEEYAPFYATYISLVGEEDIVGALQSQFAEVVAFLRTIPESQGGVCHPPYTWTVKQVVGHLSDAERIFGYRALRFARADATPLPGYEEVDYARTGEFNRVSLHDLVSEFESVRRAHAWFFRNMPESGWQRSGLANGSLVTVRALAYILVGHVRHHVAILRRRLA